MRYVGSTTLVLALVLFGCAKGGTEARTRAIDKALAPFSQIEIPTGSRLNLGKQAAATFRQFEAAGLIRIKDVPQGYWDNFATQTFMEGAQPFRIVPTQKLNEIALNPKWSAPSHTVELSQTTIAEKLESSWNYYARQKLFLGANCFGNATTFARSTGFCALELMSDFPTYQALADKGLISMDEINVAAIPATAMPAYLRDDRIVRAARVALTPSGRELAEVDPASNIATFVFGTYRLEEITKNTPIASSEGVYRLVEGTHVFELRPEFQEIWAQSGHPTYRDRKVRVVFSHDSKAGTWSVANASNGRFTAEDVGPRSGDFESTNVPPTVDDLPIKNDTGDDNYTWKVRLGELKVGEVLRDEDYKGPLATPGETFRLVIGRIDVATTGKSVPSELAKLLPGRLRSVLKYSDFAKEWQVVALDVAPVDSEQWASSNVK